MEIVPEGKNFRLVSEDELPAVADILVQYMPESLKVTFNGFEIRYAYLRNTFLLKLLAGRTKIKLAIIIFILSTQFYIIIIKTFLTP